jgi:hypothetical protein
MFNVRNLIMILIFMYYTTVQKRRKKLSLLFIQLKDIFLGVETIILQLRTNKNYSRISLDLHIMKPVIRFKSSCRCFFGLGSLIKKNNFIEFKKRNNQTSLP